MSVAKKDWLVIVTRSLGSPYGKSGEVCGTDAEKQPKLLLTRRAALVDSSLSSVHRSESNSKSQLGQASTSSDSVITFPQIQTQPLDRAGFPTTI